ncbi:MAG: DUF192 domain-containing protein [Elusimicrobiaceae bacterium]|nr:DUF192 domain-containing protein [Elusimicrobiaceae bacterium]
MKCAVRPGGQIIAEAVQVADTFLSRLAGLMFRRQLPPGQGLLLAPCFQIHTCFMRFSIDAVFCDKSGRVLYVKENMKPWRLGRLVRGGYYTLELPGGSLKGCVRPGDELLFADHFNQIPLGEITK